MLKRAFRFAILLALAAFAVPALPLVPVASAANELVAAVPSCNRVQVVSRDRGVLLSSYVVSDPDYVQKMRILIEANGENGSWTVSAGDLGALGYTVTYTCLA